MFLLLQELMEALEGQKQKRGEFLIKTFGPKWQGVDGITDFEEFLDKVGDADPTKNGAYMQWILTKAMKSPENRVEDFDRLKKDLTNFETKEIKAKLEKKDINGYASFNALALAIDEILDRKKTPEEKKAEAKAKREAEKASATRADVVTVYNGSEGWIRVPKTRAAAIYLGQSTKWCTSGKGNNMFDHYHASDSLFVIYDKSTKKRHQLHIDSGQFADEKDTNQGFKAVPTWAWDNILEWYKKESKLGLKQLLAISANGSKSDNIAKGTEHEDLFDMMKEFGVL